MVDALMDPVTGLTPAGAVWLLLSHHIGDYMLQTEWMVREKTRRLSVAFVHGFTYGVPFLLVVPSVWAWLVITITHALIDRYRLARHVRWLLALASRTSRYPLDLVHYNEGEHPDQLSWLATTLRIKTDMTMHLIINLVAVVWL